MRKRALLIVGLALLIAAAGVVYAHWTETLTVNATVNTGSIDVNWKALFSDDDGVNEIGEETGFGAPVYVYSLDGITSRDPSSAGYPTFAGRYDKDVADCLVSGEGTDTYTITVKNAYPSYHCTLWSYMGNQGTVPVKLQSIVTTFNFIPTVDGDWDTVKGNHCGDQLDPSTALPPYVGATPDAEWFLTVNTLHILNNPEGENKEYTVTQTLNFVNWNEFDSELCFHTINGTQFPLP